jgi:hypothetical protein
MHIVVAIIAIFLIIGVLWDAFETVMLPRRVSRKFRLTRLIYRTTWLPFLLTAPRIHDARLRDRILGPYGPLSLIFLLATWMILLIVGYATLQWTADSHLANPTGPVTFGTELYLSGTTIFTLGLGDVVPLSTLARFITVIEAATGFGLLALVIGYLPVLYQAFSRREVNISLLDARAGSPPSAVEMLRRHCENDREGLTQFLRDWERWAAELLESHLSYPFLGYFRSQHENQSWVAALTMIMDVCAIVTVGINEIPAQPARLTFAIARHAAVDLSQAFGATPKQGINRLPHADFQRICDLLRSEGIRFHDEAAAEAHLAQLRRTYEPYVAALAHRLLYELPPWVPAPDAHDDWETSDWETADRVPAIID